MLSNHQGKIHNVWYPTKIIKYTKKEENRNSNEEKIKTDIEITQMTNIVKRDIKTVTMVI